MTDRREQDSGPPNGIPERRRGRPSIAPSDQPSADVHVTLPPQKYDAAYKLAAEQRVSVPELLRRALDLILET
jgi:hypothetical protein